MSTPRYIRPWLIVWIPLILTLALVLWWLYRSNVEALEALTRAEELKTIQLASKTIAAELAMLSRDTQYLANQMSLRRWLESSALSAREDLEADFLTFARSRDLYDQLRFIDIHGREAVRINRDDGEPRTVPVDELQDKSTRYYVRKTLALDRGATYISPLDLNMENGRIEKPDKPVIRMGMAVFDGHGQKRGIVVLNYLAERLLNRLRGLHNRHGGNLWLINDKGYWLLGPSPETEWVFTEPDRKRQRFARAHPTVWRAIQAGSETGQLLNPEGLFTYARLGPQLLSTSPSDGHWILISHVPTLMLNADLENLNRNLLIAFIALSVLLTVTSAIVAHKELLQNKTEDAIRESETRFRNLLNSAPDAIVIIDEKGIINLINTQTENWFGYSRDELLGRSVEQLIPERFRRLHAGHRKEYAHKPTVRPMGAGSVLHGLRKDGSEFPVEISLSPTQTAQGLLITCIIRDVSRSQLQIRYQELMNNLPVGVYRNTPGPEGRYLEVNETMLTIFEAESAEELMAHSVAELYCDPSQRALVSDKIIREGSVKSEETRLKTLHGREFYAAITAAVKKDANGNLYFDGILKDISERKEDEQRIRELNESLSARTTELEAINRELEAFSYSVSHDLRAPLRAIDGFSRSLVNEYADRLDEKGRDRLHRVRAAAQRMADLIDDLLNLSRVTRTEINREAINLTPIADEVIQALRQSDPLRKLEFSVHSPLITQGDPRLLRIVMDNLIGNAWKFTGQRADAKITIGVKTQGSEICYFVQDNGVGFDMSYADMLFGAFQRLHDTNEFPGSGIGLATVQRIIHKHGGRIWAESSVGNGATFYFTLRPQATA
ncbi:MAG: sensor histidine kinase [Gammaproteobacteria bacterium]